MKLDRDYFENQTYNWKPIYKFFPVCGNIGAYVYDRGEIWFEIDTLERIGGIYEVDNRTNFKRYFHSGCTFGWDGKRKTEKEFCKKLCTKADYITAKHLLLDEYNNRKAA